MEGVPVAQLVVFWQVPEPAEALQALPMARSKISAAGIAIAVATKAANGRKDLRSIVKIV